ncbi:hypothetical protein ERJ70_00960 [Sediminibacillus dalangtanensis]|uniref:DUF2524 domain-containing protein n=1 Tax=Sediminibacillus dalangtanensis TaxID=2729421 RepID=A0ABX7VML4_9BACI|nr:hypothetical protein [Sediminibacillus dalangtanensis]QTM98016.1 hypothetical protein ERJ70_00960 [Sediminibacillus dalangtanensis]
MKKEDNPLEAATTAINRAQQWTELAQTDPGKFTESQNHLTYAQEQLALAHQSLNSLNEEEKQQLQRADDLLRLLKQTQQSIIH